MFALFLYASYRLFWRLFGHEVITLANGRLSVRAFVLGRAIRDVEYLSTDIRNLRFHENVSSSRNPNWTVSTEIGFEYRGSRQQFGDGVRMEDGWAVVDRICERCPWAEWNAGHRR